MTVFKRIINKITLAVKIYKFGGNFYYKIKLFLFVLLQPILNVVGVKNLKNNSFKIKNNNGDFLIFISDSSDMCVFKEMFIKKEYDLNLENEPDVIFDLGSNSGFSVLYFKSKYPKAKIYAFEPDPVIFEKLKLNCRQFPDIQCYNVAVSDKDGYQDFYINTKASLSSSLIKRPGYDRTIKVPIRSLDSIINELEIKQIDLLKFDIEGNEYVVFKDFHNFKTIKNMIGELHLDLMDASHNDFLNIFKSDFKITEKPLSSKRFIVDMRSKQY